MADVLYADPAVSMFTAEVTSSDSTVMTIEEQGEQRYGKAVNTGTATLVAKTDNGKSAQCTVHVGREVPAESLELVGSQSIKLHTGYAYRPEIRILPEYTDQQGYTLTSSDPDIVSVNENGTYSLLLGNRAGTAAITASLRNNPEKSISFNVTVEDGQGGNGEFAQTMYHLNERNKLTEYMGSMEEYTCYVGERYLLKGFKVETRRVRQEFNPAGFLCDPSILENTNSCVVKSMEPGFGASGPIIFFPEFSTFSFTAAHEGTALIRLNDFRTVRINVVKKESPVSVYGNSLALEGKIGVNYYLEIPENDISDTDIHLVFNGKDTVIHAEDLLPRTVNGRHTRLVSMFVSAKEMRDPILLRVSDRQGNRKKLLDTVGKDVTETGYEYSVARYFEKAGISGSDKLIKLSAVMDTYGKWAQVYFNYHTDQFDTTDDVSSVTPDMLEQYKAEASGTVPGLSYIGGSLELSSDTSVRVYFTLAQGHSIGEYSFTVNGKKVSAVSRGNDRYYIALDNIAAQDLHKSISFTAEKGNDQIVVNYSPMSYEYTAMTSDKTGDAIKNTCRALYLYNQQAIEYFSN